ncbi:SDR family NAD(P)-dependent oxidoreductase [Salinibacillus xinjiangensis]|uniref:SDR family oxidoreductase n=1 Tax=Salinibacillus xinjiangensis TaxID=1229268 RepID=A0A6G1X1N5_9BACI|nr:SDR family oxidoreductase [Salinibacillus xinjiangensis]MRG84901.1 SDR family oxidoreductase [Salinibacillus xinjiangensis]
MDLSLTDKVAIVTGGSKGIGFQTALHLVREGAKMTICARGQENLETAAAKIKEETGGSVIPIQADVRKAEDCQMVVEETIKQFGRLDILINNAGTSSAKSFEEVDLDTWAEDMDLKLYGAINFSKSAVPYMKEVGKGSIINITAVIGKTPPGSSLPTSVSRAAGLGLTKAMSKDLGKYSIRVNAVCIGLIKSDQIQKRWQRTAGHLTWEEYSKDPKHAIPLGRIGETEEAANVITYLASDAASYVTGTAINVDGGRGAAL